MSYYEKIDLATCPYDGDWCKVINDQLMVWANAIKKLADEQSSHIFLEPKSCDTCGYELTCQRYKRYMHVKQQIKQNAK